MPGFSRSAEDHGSQNSHVHEGERLVIDEDVPAVVPVSKDSPEEAQEGHGYSTSENHESELRDRAIGDVEDQPGKRQGFDTLGGSHRHAAPEVGAILGLSQS